ncbi:carboxyl methyl esterase [Schizosaccharomyces japonicus yFS275]|uniref:Protein phosphatase methylesterase 1 n=1 Tax=Schizosaccharomyces japonicus (strain yFS275 / FY16936) TaxID=402676 RepID=B6JYG6_SCHJY|nr:carboxyl methyl esterase [Schizosaccharomyces japonicus yFS275]EEB06584.1 carboxyl methyl esterase [Schizosaccharomyces japonicus yFS275]
MSYLLKKAQKNILDVTENSEDASTKKGYELAVDEKLENWSLYFEEEVNISTDAGTIHGFYTAPKKDGCLFVLQHGAGSSAMSFAPVARELAKMSDNQVGVLSVDLRGHGETALTPNTDYSLSTLTNDLVHALQFIKERLMPGTQMFLVGHSLGGAVCATLTYERLVPGINGLAVLDVVEGSAIEALAHMQQYLSTRPKKFRSIKDAITWHLKTLTIRNSNSANATVPSLLQKNSDNMYVWRTDLLATYPYWSEWFTGLSDKFLGTRGGRLLVLAGTDRLDKKLTIGQMQGKYQLEVLPETGHFLHEDAPGMISDLLIHFWHRNQPLKLPPKVGQSRLTA